MLGVHKTTMIYTHVLIGGPAGAQFGRHALRQGKIVMPARIKRRDKPRDRAQPAANRGFGALLSLGPMACHVGRISEHRILCGSV
jgi:hypothetical protein